MEKVYAGCPSHSPPPNHFHPNSPHHTHSFQSARSSQCITALNMPSLHSFISDCPYPLYQDCDSTGYRQRPHVQQQGVCCWQKPLPHSLRYSRELVGFSSRIPTVPLINFIGGANAGNTTIIINLYISS